MKDDIVIWTRNLTEWTEEDNENRRICQAFAMKVLGERVGPVLARLPKDSEDPEVLYVRCVTQALINVSWRRPKNGQKFAETDASVLDEDEILHRYVGSFNA